MPFRVTLPDGAIKEGKKWITTPMDIAKEISSGFAASCLIAQVDETLWDMGRPLEGDCKLQMFKFDTNEGRDTFWHSSAHILGEVSWHFACSCLRACFLYLRIVIPFHGILLFNEFQHLFVTIHSFM
jgi:threonyl-tRNA synthetase